VLTTETGEEISREMFRFVDSDGRLVALRPEMTTPIARAVAQRMSGEAAPYRLHYVANVFRDEAAQRGQQREFWQAGVELIGASGPAADMEVVAVTAEALSAAGLEDFRIGIGHVGVFRALLGTLGVDEATRHRAEKMATSRDLVGLRELLSGVSAEAGEAVVTLVGTRGSAEAIERARAIVSLGVAEQGRLRVDPGEGDGAVAGDGAKALDELAETYRLLEAYGLASRVMLDFGIISNFDYYTGFVMEAYAPGVAFPLGAGGRYDSLLAEFGRPMPAAGCAVGLERLHIAIAGQSEVVTAGTAHVRVAWETDPAAALLVAKELRAEGVAATVELDPAASEDLAARAHARQEPAVLVRSGADGLVLMDPLTDTKSFATVEGLVKELSG